ncbi:acyltransferase [Salinilacustrithrix flava]|uniref:acyltransferase n=1 Tax=Salinilacustrithrix flava TaxID=2957203 RepID=UPI003D7C156D
MLALYDKSRTLERLGLGARAVFWRALGVNWHWRRRWPVIHSHTRFRGANRIHLEPRATIYPFAYLKSAGGVILVGERSSIGEFSYLNAVERISVGTNVLIGPGVHITDANHGIAAGAKIKDQKRTVKPVSIEDDCWIGAGSKVLAGVTIGRGAVVGAGSVVTADVRAGAVVGGTPAKIIRMRS